MYCPWRTFWDRLLVGRSGVALDEVGGLLQAAGGGDMGAFAAFYERTASMVFGLLHHALGESAAAERATVRVYVRVWRSAPAFDPAVMTGGAFLMQVMHREFGGPERRADAPCGERARSHGGRHAERVGRILERLEPSDLRREVRISPAGARDEAPTRGPRAR